MATLEEEEKEAVGGGAEMVVRKISERTEHTGSVLPGSAPVSLLYSGRGSRRRLRRRDARDESGTWRRAVDDRKRPAERVAR